MCGLTCEGCSWLHNNMWCDMKRSGRHITDPKCDYYTTETRKFDPNQFYTMCCKFIEMYDNLQTRKFNQNTLLIDTVFDEGSVELISFVLNDMKRELEYYHRWDLDECLNQEELLLSYYLR